jgi:N6-adenosine-specific RNA methylase IME4
LIDLRQVEGAGTFRAVSADAPWHHSSYSIKGQGRSPSRHYPTMPLKDICALPVADVVGKDCHLFMWTTQPHLQQSFQVIEAWGFKYSSVFAFWIKLSPKKADVMWMQPSDFPMGMGFTTRKNVELLLLGRRGSPKRLVKNMPDLIFAARREHSRKPDLAYQRIEQYCVGPRLDLFPRESRPGWVPWGNEADKFDLPAAPARQWLNPDKIKPAAPAAMVAAPMFDQGAKLKFHAIADGEHIEGQEAIGGGVDESPDMEIPAFLRRLAGS